ncbi:hypothetical protein BZA05DRAFT_179459 [Tricharina praecox]|uniref:uncharacterized protein n=1 Tax=Tricharina praecox TaxID=43433 RepID=UPI0022202C68|nr:uncharacterized protein BZA05DRAFT_179459 [Tricharina praecox]KAI5843700.1 hypothetical protein BZA05DRAFT_179459 [Tricharina praecox]
MAKSRPTAPRTRALKRAATPPLDLSTTITRPSSPPPLQKVAALQLRSGTTTVDNGVKKSKSKPLTRHQRERKAKALERAEAATEKLAAKREESFVKARVVQGRRGNWEVLNEKMQDDLEEALALATVHTPIENVKKTDGRGEAVAVVL